MRRFFVLCLPFFALSLKELTAGQPIISPSIDTIRNGSLVNLTCCLEGSTSGFVWFIAGDHAIYYNEVNERKLNDSCSQLVFTALPFHGNCDVLIRCLLIGTDTPAKVHLTIEGVFPELRISVNQFNKTHLTLSWNTTKFTDVTYTVYIDSHKYTNTSESSFLLPKPDKPITVSVWATNGTCKGKIAEQNLTAYQTDVDIDLNTSEQGSLSLGAITGITCGSVVAIAAIVIGGIIAVYCWLSRTNKTDAAVSYEREQHTLNDSDSEKDSGSIRKRAIPMVALESSLKKRPQAH